MKCLHYIRVYWRLIAGILTVGIIVGIIGLLNMRTLNWATQIKGFINRGQFYLKDIAHNHGVAGQIIDVKNEIKYIQLILRYLNSSDSSKHFTDLLTASTNNLATSLFQEAYRGPFKNEFSQHDFWNKHSAFVDPWGSPYNFKVSASTNANGNVMFHIRIWSSGRNRVNEQQRGDDVNVKELDLD